MSITLLNKICVSKAKYDDWVKVNDSGVKEGLASERSLRFTSDHMQHEQEQMACQPQTGHQHWGTAIWQLRSEMIKNFMLADTFLLQHFKCHTITLASITDDVCILGFCLAISLQEMWKQSRHPTFQHQFDLELGRI